MFTMKQNLIIICLTIDHYKYIMIKWHNQVMCNKCLCFVNEKCTCTSNNYQIMLQHNLTELKLIDLCAGTGAFSYAFRKKGIETIFANDFDKYSEKAYKTNFPNHKFSNKNIIDIDTKNIPCHDVLCAGFPCQSFSLAGEKKGFDDVRANVFFKIIDIMKCHRPAIVILENVKNLISHNSGETFKRIQKEITISGYYYKYSVLSTCDFTGVPQGRERIYIVCFRNPLLNSMFNFDFPKVDKCNLKDFVDKTVDEKYYYSDKYKIYQTLVNGMVKSVDENVIYQFRRFYVRENKNGCCPTLTANMGTGGHNVPLILINNRIRKLTPRECFRLQGFPENYILPDCFSAIKY